MKIRNGFVSNSSSSSFCIYGISLEFDNTDFDEVFGLIKKIQISFPEKYHEALNSYINDLKDRLKKSTYLGDKIMIYEF